MRGRLVRRRGSSETVGVTLGAVGAACSRDAIWQAPPVHRDCKSLPQSPLVSAFSQRSTRGFRARRALFFGTGLGDRLAMKQTLHLAGWHRAMTISHAPTLRP
jgi:membrane glycosyltransferase